MFSSLDLRQVMVNFFAIVIALTVHEYAHAWVADRMGDPTPRRAGRLVFSPIPIMQAHPFGALVVPLLGAVSGFLIGWAATPVNPHLVNRKYTLRQAERWIAAAGPLSNLLLGLISIVFFALLVPYQQSEWGTPLYQLCRALVFVNALLMVFNLIPIPPLDGFTVLESSAPPSLRELVGFFRRYGTLVLLLIFMKGSLIFGPLFFGIAKLLYLIERAILL